MHQSIGGVILGTALIASACSSAVADVAESTTPPAAAGTAAPSTSSAAQVTTTTTAPSLSVPPTTAETTTTSVTTTTESPFARPDWLGTRVLPLRDDGWGEVQPTPPELIDRRFETIDLLPQPGDDTFRSTLGPVPADVLARSSWSEECPVTVDDLVYLTVSHYGFDGEFHTGELIINASVGQDIVGVFSRLHAARFPIEQMRVVSAEAIDAPPTGDWNDTTSFACRRAVGSNGWSQHAFGLAVDINPFHNPYVKGELVLPELASAYVDRSDVRPGMIVPDDVVDRAFREIGWTWGGRWSSLVDWMHFSQSGG